METVSESEFTTEWFSQSELMLLSEFKVRKKVNLEMIGEYGSERYFTKRQ